VSVSLQAVKRVVANVVDFDMHNLFEPFTWTESLQEAAKGSFETVPESIVQHELHGGQPLRVMPDYGRNLLDRLQERQHDQSQTVLPRLISEFQKKRQKEAADPNNLYDFSMPSEWHKHQEQPVPNEMLDTFVEFNRPGEDAGHEILKQWHDRGWDPNDAPEMSEDLLNRRRAPPKSQDMTFKVNPVRVVRAFLSQFQGPDPSYVVSSFLMQTMPVQLSLEQGMTREAARLKDLSHPMVYNKKKGYHPLDLSGVTVRLIKAEPKQARWRFKSQSHTENEPDYTVIFQFKPSGAIRDLNKLDVFVSCDCPSWIYYGAQYNAFMGDYLFGPIQLKRGPFGKPKIRDQSGHFKICKHVLKCIPFISGRTLEGELVKGVPGYILPSIPKEIRDRMEKERKTRVVKIEPKYKITIPMDLADQEDIPEVKEGEHHWPAWSPMRRKRFINDLQDPDSVAYFAYRYPNTATVFVADRLKQMILKGPPEKKAEAREQLEEIMT